MLAVSDDEELERLKQIRLKSIKESNTSAAVVAKPVKVTDADFDGFIAKHSLSVVDCWAAWCYPCRMVEPVVEQLAHDYAGRVVFGKLNVDDNPGTAMKFGVMSIPTLLFFNNGELATRVVGAVPRAQIESVLRSLL